MRYKLFSISICASLTLSISLMMSAPSAALAQTTVPAISGSTLDGKPFSLNQTRGKATVLFFWTTDCAICRDKMAELRERSKQWRDKPFSMVLVNMDKRMQDIDAYNSIINRSVPEAERLPQLWALGKDYADNLGTLETIKEQVSTELPLVYVMDKSGKVVARHQGRFPVSVWQDVAGLF